MTHPIPTEDRETQTGVRVTKEGVLTRPDLIAFVLLACFSAAAIFFFFVHWFSFGDWLAYPITFTALTLVVLVKVAKFLLCSDPQYFLNWVIRDLAASGAHIELRGQHQDDLLFLVSDGKPSRSNGGMNRKTGE